MIGTFIRIVTVVMVTVYYICISLAGSPDHGSVLAQGKRSHVSHVTDISGVILLQRYKCGS